MKTVDLVCRVTLDIHPELEVDEALLASDVQSALETGFEGAPEGILEDVVQVQILTGSPQ